MIVKMKKYAFLVYHKDYRHFLNSLQQQGVLHVKERGQADIEGGDLKDKLLLLNRIQESIKFLDKIIKSKIDGGFAPISQGPEILQHLDTLRLEDEQLVQSISNTEKDVAVLKPWGPIDWNTIEKMENDGWSISFFSAPPRNWIPDWENNYNAFQIAQNSGNVLFVTITKKGDKFEFEADKVKLPRKELKAELAEIARFQQEKSNINDELKSFAISNLSSLMHYKNQVQQELDFDKVVCDTGKVAEGKIALLEGFIPVDKEVEFQKFLNSEGLFYETRIPELTDKVPVLLKNNRFARLFEPIGDLYTLPNYNELDLTALYAPFYWLFFGFCLGDAGYGLVLMMAGFIMARKVRPGLKRIMLLIGFLGISTILFGLISGTFFGMNLYELRLGFYASLDDLLKAKDTNINQALFNLSLLLGAIQVIYGMFIKVANEVHQSGLRSAFSTIGWIIILFGIGIHFLLKKSGVDLTTVAIVSGIILFTGFLGAFIFNSPGNILINFGLGLWGAYNMATGLMGDILSYIRLFALSICGGILGYVYNSLAFSLAPDIPVVRILVIVLILAAGHTINLMIGILGAFVHPMRLTFVEFYKNAGFSGGGKKYHPFKNRIMH
jgi:V/A-type H+-transporting ATPase subunit I